MQVNNILWVKFNNFLILIQLINNTIKLTYFNSNKMFFYIIGQYSLDLFISCSLGKIPEKYCTSLLDSNRLTFKKIMGPCLLGVRILFFNNLPLNPHYSSLFFSFFLDSAENRFIAFYSKLFPSSYLRSTAFG